MRTLPFRLGRFTLFDHVATGGMADIYLARVKTDLGGARVLVIKEMLPSLASDARWSEMLIDEAKLAAQLSHANIARVEELGRHEGSLYIAMEYVEGLDLRELLKQCSARKIPLPMEYRLYIVREVLRALDYAHRYRLEEAIGIVHRDVSPSNVLLSFGGEVKLCDFGIASAVSFELAPSETIEGKAGYMSPEQARGEPLDERADLFAAGILLWELLAGKRAYKATPDAPLLQLARRGEVPPLRKLSVPEEERLRAIVERALARELDDRYESAAAMYDDLYGYCLATKQMASALRFGDWLSAHFAAEKVARRRARERALTALEFGPPVVLRPVESTPGRRSTPGERPSARGANRDGDEARRSETDLVRAAVTSTSGLAPRGSDAGDPPSPGLEASDAEDAGPPRFADAPSSEPALDSPGRSLATRSEDERAPPSWGPTSSPSLGPDSEVPGVPRRRRSLGGPRLAVGAFVLTFVVLCVLAWLGVLRW